MKPLLGLPSHAVNGLAVALGVGLIQLLVGALAGAQAAALALSGAVCASLADVPNTVPRTLSRVPVAAVLSLAATLLALLLQPVPWALGIAIALLGFGAMMTMAWGPRAGAVSFAPILALIFAMGVPPQAAPLPVLLGWNAVGAAAYLGWALLSGRVLQRRYRALALAQLLDAAARLLRARARLLTTPAGAFDDTRRMQAWISGEAELAEALQRARDFIYAQPDGAHAQRDTQIVLLAVELRDVLLASRLDLDLLGRDAASQWILERVAAGLQSIAAALDAAATAAQRGAAVQSQVLPTLDSDALFAHAPLAADDPRARLLPALRDRLQRLDADVRRIHALQRGEPAHALLSHAELQHFVSPEGWPPAALRAQWHWRSPVLRHALRAGLALAMAYCIALLLPWASHPHWLVLSVAVVLRGSLEQTLARRNARVLGTMLGCVLVLGLSFVNSAAALSLVFLLAVGTAHAFALRRYWLTATAATVMALLQQHLVHPAGGYAIPERVADTLLGALLAWGFSYVLPWWERRSLPDAIELALRELHDYALHALRIQPSQPVAQGLSRRRAYDALAALAAAMQRSTAEPRAVRLPLHDVAAFIDHGQRLMAHLSLVRITLNFRHAALDDTAAQALAQTAAALTGCLSLTNQNGWAAAADEADALLQLPAQPPAQDILPWLLRRLALLVHDAQHIRAAAMAALAAARP